MNAKESNDDSCGEENVKKVKIDITVSLKK